MNELALIWTETQSVFWLYATVFYRASAAVTVLPGFGESYISVRFKLVIAFATTLAIAPTQHSTIVLLPSIWLILSETIVGLMFGLGARLFVFALQTAGTIAANATSLAQMFGQGQDTQLPIIGLTLHWAGLALIFVSGTHLAFLGYLASSYDLFPIGTWPNPQDTSSWGVLQIANSFSLALQLSLPFVAISMLYNLVLGVINRAMPQLMVALVGAPFITGASLIILMISAPFILYTWLSLFGGFIRSPM